MNEKKGGILNKQECDILTALVSDSFINQRFLAELSGHSLDVASHSIKELIQLGYLDENIQLTPLAIREFNQRAPKRAIILAAGFGMRMVPINLETPKALLKVKGERLIERQIKQLHEVGIREVYIVVGFMKEQFEYLIDEYGVELIFNPDYAKKNNLYSLSLASRYLNNSYIVPSDIWCDTNPFRRKELYSWYMVSDMVDEDSEVRVNRKMELVKNKGDAGNAMIGISYLLPEEAETVRSRINVLCSNSEYDDCFWEETLYKKDRMILSARVVHSSEVVEINTYEQLRELDHNSEQLKSDAIVTIAKVLGTSMEEIIDISILKKGMTNRSFLFSCKGEKYIMRIPGEGTDKLINRRQEADVYRAILGRGLCDDPVYINPENGYKITKFLEGIRVCDSTNMKDLKKCMEKLRTFHHMKLVVDHEFDIFDQIEFYESLWEDVPSIYKDYSRTKQNVLSLRPYIEAHVKEKTLTHIDAVSDNFLFYDGGNGEELQLTDWEYAGMQDPHVDVAMFCVYAMYNKRQVDRLISIYFEGNCPDEVRIKIYCYIATCGLLWSNWCEYKRNLGIEFGEYSLRQYRFAKDYYKIATEEMEQQSKCVKIGDDENA